MYIFTVFIYKKDLQYLWKASRRHQTRSHLPSFVLFRGSPTDTVWGPRRWLSLAPVGLSFLLSDKASPWATDLTSFQVIWTLKMWHHLDLYRGYIIRIFPYSLYIFLVNTVKQEFTLLLSIKTKWKNLRVLSLSVTVSSIFILCIYEFSSYWS